MRKAQQRKPHTYNCDVHHIHTTATRMMHNPRQHTLHQSKAPYSIHHNSVPRHTHTHTSHTAYTTTRKDRAAQRHTRQACFTWCSTYRHCSIHGRRERGEGNLRRASAWRQGGGFVKHACVWQLASPWVREDAKRSHPRQPAAQSSAPTPCRPLPTLGPSERE